MNTNQTTTTQNSTRLVVLFVLFFLSTFGMFGQTTNTVAASTITFETSVASNDDTTTTATTAVEANANMNMVSWFMGTKQTAKNNTNTGDVDFSKKQMINSGTAPNRLLMKAFLKKAASYQSTIA